MSVLEEIKIKKMSNDELAKLCNKYFCFTNTPEEVRELLRRFVLLDASLRYTQNLCTDLCIYEEIIGFLIDALEEEHLGMRGWANVEIEKRWKKDDLFYYSSLVEKLYKERLLEKK